MTAFKPDLYEICRGVADEFSGWGFSSGQFKNKTLKHTDLIVHLGFGFEGGATPVQPSIHIINKRVSKLCRSIFGVDGYASIVSLQAASNTLKYTPEKLRTGFWVVQHKEEFLSLGQASQAVEDVTLDMIEARAALVATMKDGISFIENHYDLGGEDALLRGLPAKYTTRHVNSPYDQMEKMKGVMICLVRILLGDFDFVLNYRSDEFKTLFPKRFVELDRIIEVLPELKRKYDETGAVI
ncbi:hypothetical protein [Ralstonia pseudosolanacearum]|uniref:hypothetical protein n=1 Tax=Ralstonia pseudosolanacearum TaxID=1310165 RepID=UPI00186760B8|nr:hypothetical protein [Ralstonia pseudosolanacearum]QOK94351.1 hypothetical protein HF908_23485 [Ralstonia pseudosolanacearum]UWD92088.1 hypothetical protein NY025_14000 [Ralstonia pseudosolanacearum]CAH0445717.1 hypothetical protein LMG9673_04686 [Ralstonia pseudosolanacearum]